MVRGEPKKNQDALQALFTNEHLQKQWEKEHEVISKVMKKRSTIRSGHGGVAATLRRVDAVDAILLRGGWRPRCDLVATLINPHRKTSAAAGACGKAGVAAQGRHRRDQGIPRRPHRLPNRRAYHINQACQRVQRADEAVVSQRRRRRRGLGAPAHGGKSSEIRGRR